MEPDRAKTMQEIAKHFLQYYKMKKAKGEEKITNLYIQEKPNPNNSNNLDGINDTLKPLIDSLPLVSEAIKDPAEIPRTDDFLSITVLVSFPVLTLFVETSPTSFVPVSPKVNHRSIDRAEYYKSFGIEEGTSFYDAMKKPVDSSFQRMSLVCFPYSICNESESETWLQSLATRRVDRKVLTIQVPNKSLTFVTKEHFDQTLKLFGTKTCPGINWEYFFKQIEYDLSTEAEIDNLMQQMQIPTTIFDAIKNRSRVLHPEATTYQTKLNRLRHFIQMCTPVRFSFPEGQHRIEATTRILYGYKLDQDILDVEHEDFEIHPQNTVFQKVTTALLKPKDETELKKSNTWQNDVCRKLQQISAAVTKESTMVFHSSYRETFSTFIQNILKPLYYKHQLPDFIEDNWWKLNVSASKGTSPPIREKLLRFQRTLFLALVHFLLNHNPYMQELKDMVSEQQVKDLIDSNDGWKWWPGGSFWAFRNPYSQVSSCV